MYSLGANINFYMIHGGTNFGFWNGAETNAPVRVFLFALYFKKNKKKYCKNNMEKYHCSA